jgi:dynactin complex subunit
VELDPQAIEALADALYESVPDVLRFPSESVSLAACEALRELNSRLQDLETDLAAQVALTEKETARADRIARENPSPRAIKDTFAEDRLYEEQARFNQLMKDLENLQKQIAQSETMAGVSLGAPLGADDISVLISEILQRAGKNRYYDQIDLTNKMKPDSFYSENKIKNSNYKKDHYYDNQLNNFYEDKYYPNDY